MMRKQQYQASDYKCTLIDLGHRPETPVRPSMLRNAPIVLAVLLVFGSSGLSAGAFARDGSYGAGRAGVGVRGNNLGLDGTPGDGYDGYRNRASGLRGEFRGNQGRDVWGHWGAYYGPMIPMT
jgi:hypothetical protein